jgi:hypothetical protein
MSSDKLYRHAILVLLLTFVPTGILYTMLQNTVFTQELIDSKSFWYYAAKSHIPLKYITYAISSIVFGYTVYRSKQLRTAKSFDSLTIVFVFVMNYHNLIQLISGFRMMPLASEHIIIRFIVSVVFTTLWVLCFRYALKHVDNVFSLALSAAIFLLVLRFAIEVRLSGITIHYVKMFLNRQL